MHRRTVRQVTAWSGIFSLAAVILSYLLAFIGGVPPTALIRHFPDVLFPGFAPQLGRPVIFALWSLVAGNLLLILFFIGLKERSDSENDSIPFVAGIIQAAMIISMLIALFSIGLLKGLAPAIQEVDTLSPSLRGTTQTLIAFRNYSALFAGLLVAVSCGALGIVSFRRSKFRRSWVLAAGILLAVGTFWPLLEPLGYLRNLGYLMFHVWVGHVGFLLLRTDNVSFVDFIIPGSN